MAFLVILFGIVAFLALYPLFNKDPEAPPGPYLLPYIGNLLSFPMTSEPHIGMAKLAKRYGDVMSIKIGSMNTVVLSSISAARDVLARPEVQMFRPVNVFFKARALGKDIGLGFSNGETWRQVRMFTMNKLKDAGLGHNHVTERVVLSELEYLHKQLKLSIERNKGMVEFGRIFDSFSANFIMSFLWDKRFEPDHKLLQQFLDGCEYFNKYSSFALSLTTAFPWTFRISQKADWVKKLIGAINDLYIIPGEIIRSRKAEMSDQAELFPDKFFKKMGMLKTDFEKKTFTEEQLQAVLMDLMQASTDTTAGFLEFVVLYVATFPEVQERIFQEINQIDGPILLKHKKQTPFTDATIMEIHRFAKIAVTLLPREAERTFYYKGYKIKKGTCIIANQEIINFESKVWENPSKFNPDRFLAADGSLDVEQCRKLIPYGIGKRACPGQALAEQALYLSTANIIKRYKFSLPSGTKPDLQSLPGLLARPAPFSAYVEGRPCSQSLNLTHTVKIAQ